MANDRVVVIVFPHVTIEVPHVGLVSEIGHAGVLLINGKNGRTKYYEYGRYDSAGLGIVRNKAIPDVTVDSNGEPNRDKLRATYRSITTQSGKKTTINSVMIKTEKSFDDGVALCQARLAQNGNPRRAPYSVLTNNCVTFADSTAKALVSTFASLCMPVWNPIPHTYILALQMASLLNPDAQNLDYDFMTNRLT
jgi:hypothetical protein